MAGIGLALLAGVIGAVVVFLMDLFGAALIGFWLAVLVSFPAYLVLWRLGFFAGACLAQRWYLAIPAFVLSGIVTYAQFDMLPLYWVMPALVIVAFGLGAAMGRVARASVGATSFGRR